MRLVPDAERRSRLAARHLLGRSGSSPAGVARALVALHATGPAAVFLSIWARMAGVSVAEIEAALYGDRSLVRVLGMRRTVFAVPAEIVPVIHSACTRAIAERERRRLAAFLEQGGITEDGAGWLRRVGEATLEQLRSRGEAYASELTPLVPGLQAKLRLGGDRPWAAEVGVSTRVLFLLAADGRIVRGRPRGSWTSSQYRWSPVERWLPGGVPDLPLAEAQAELARLWLQAYGPGTEADVGWWTGWTARETRRALSGAGAVAVELEGGTGYVLPDDLEPVAAPPPAASLLPALDPTVMGWKERSWYLGPHAPALFDRSGNAGPTIWWEGRVVGGWAQREGRVVTALLEDAGAEAAGAIEAEARRLESWLGGTRVVPAFRTPLERSLAAAD